MMSIIKTAKIVPTEAVVSAPESIRIEREFQAVQEEVLGKLFYRFVAEALSGKQFRMSRFRVRGANRFPTGRLDLTIAPFDRSELIGNVGLRATVQVDGKKCGRLTLLAWVDRFEPVVCAARAVAHNTVLTEADLTVTSVNIAEFPPGTLTDVKEVIGQNAKVTIRPGTPIRTAMLAPAPLVQKGERVKIVAASGRLKVAAMGIAKTSGGMGEQIQVENVASNKTIVGRVTGESTVAVLF